MMILAAEVAWLGQAARPHFQPVSCCRGLPGHTVNPCAVRRVANVCTAEHPIPEALPNCMFRQSPQAADGGTFQAR